MPVVFENLAANGDERQMVELLINQAQQRIDKKKICGSFFI
ncbi:hypothetical protein [Neochlamydia sp. S13]|nr:hypothetical protein [Neochlamydia sp. S13]